MTPLTKPKLLAYLAGIFIAGAVSGGFIGYNTKSERRGPPPGRPPSSDQWIGMIRQKFAEEVGVTEDQWSSQVGPIITNTVREIGELDARNRERIGEMITRSDAQVMDLLTADQKPRMQRMIEERQKHHFGRKRGERRDRREGGDKLLETSPNEPAPKGP